MADAAPGTPRPPVGEERTIGRIIGLSIVTMGVYFFYWQYKCYEELKRFRGEGVDGVVGILLGLVGVGTFLLPAYVGRAYVERRHPRPVNGYLGLWAFVPYVGYIAGGIAEPSLAPYLWVAAAAGGLYWFWKFQTALNELWRLEAVGPPPPRRRSLAERGLERVRTEVGALERRALGDRPSPVAHRVFNRALSAIVVGVLATVIVAPFFGFDLTAVFVWLVFVALYVPPWEYVPRFGRFIRPAAALALALTYPFYWDRMFTIPIFGEFPDIATGVVIMVFIMMAIGLNIVVGYAGLLDLGYVAFYAIGAYTAAWFASVQFANRNIHFGSVGVGPTVPGIHISIWLILILAALLTALVGVIIGLPTLRLRGDYLAIVTLGFGEILPQVARNGDNFFGSGFNLTNGPNGITPIDPPGFGKTLHDVTGGVLPNDYATALNSDNLFFWTAILLVLFTIFCSVRLRDSRLGRAWIAIREDEVAASAMGVPLMRTKTWAYAGGAFFGGIAGAYYASFKSATFPGDFFFNISVFILCMVILGGMGNIWGVIVGAAFLEYLDREGLANIGAWINDHLGRHLGGWTVDVPQYEAGIFGVILVIVMLFRPQGLIPSARRKAEFEEGVADQPLYDVAH